MPARTPQVHNPCVIPADCKLFIEGKDSAFSVEPREIHVMPGQSVTAKVWVCMDDTRVSACVCACVYVCMSCPVRA